MKIKNISTFKNPSQESSYLENWACSQHANNDVLLCL
jgi:hypothetical protein